MVWELDFNDKEFSLQAAIAKGRPLPQWAIDEPVALPGSDFYLTAFYQLSSCRQYIENIGPGPIPWDKIVMYADRRGLDEEVSEAFEFIIREIDGAYLKWYSKKQKAMAPKPKKPPKRTGRKR